MTDKKVVEAKFQALAMLAKKYPSVSVSTLGGELGTLDGLEDIPQADLFAHILLLQTIILEARKTAGVGFRDGKSLDAAIADHLAEVDRLTKERDETIVERDSMEKLFEEEEKRAAKLEQRISELTTANEEKAKKIVGLFVAFAPDTEPYQRKIKEIDAILNGGQQ